MQVVCFQELFYGPYFCRGAESEVVRLVEKVPDGPTTKLFSELAKKLGIVIVLPVYEEDITGVYYNTAAVIDADGTFLGKFRKIHIPHCGPGFFEKFYFRPGNLGYPVFDTRDRKVGVYICYDRHFPRDGARSAWRRGDRLQSLGHGRGINRISVEARATRRRRQYLLRRRHQPSGLRGAVAHRRVLRKLYFANPRGQIIAKGPATTTARDRRSGSGHDPRSA